MRILFSTKKGYHLIFIILQDDWWSELRLQKGLDRVDHWSCSKVTTRFGCMSGMESMCHQYLSHSNGCAVESVPIQVLEDLWMKLQHWLYCGVASGTHIEHFQVIKETDSCSLPNCLSIFEMLKIICTQLALLINGPIVISQLHSRE
jgi:hypothetical protein